MAHQVGDLVARAVKRLDLCSNDPICAEHGEGSEHYTLQGRHFTHARIVNPILETACECLGIDPVHQRVQPALAGDAIVIRRKFSQEVEMCLLGRRFR